MTCSQDTSSSGSVMRLQNGDQLTNWYGEIFQFSDDGAGNRAIQSLISGDAYPVLTVHTALTAVVRSTPLEV